jgi:hypothetical protein
MYTGDQFKPPFIVFKSGLGYPAIQPLSESRNVMAYRK